MPTLTPEEGWPTTDHRRRTTDDGPPTTDHRRETIDDGPQTTDHRRRTTDDRYRLLICGDRYFRIIYDVVKISPFAIHYSPENCTPVKHMNVSDTDTYVLELFLRHSFSISYILAQPSECHWHENTINQAAPNIEHKRNQDIDHSDRRKAGN